MTRADEIKALQSLKGDTYFAHLFDDAQIDAMCENIKNDFPIECGIDLFAGSEVAKENARLTAAIQRQRDNDCDAALAILRKSVEHDDDGMDAIAHMLIGIKNCLRLKLAHNIALSSDDREALLNIIDNA